MQAQIFYQAAASCKWRTMHQMVVYASFRKCWVPQDASGVWCVDSNLCLVGQGCGQTLQLVCGTNLHIHRHEHNRINKPDGLWVQCGLQDFVNNSEGG